MKKIFKNTFLFVFAFVCFGIVSIYAKEDCDSAYHNADAIATCKRVEEYCMKGSGQYTKGCKYDENNTLYTYSGNVTNQNLLLKVTSGNLKLTQGYEGLDANGNVVFAGCYKGYSNKTDKWNFHMDAYYYYVFKVVKLSGSKCTVQMSDIVPEKGTHYGTTGWKPYSFDGQNGIGNNGATYRWTATGSGRCPYAFALTQNVKGYTSDKNRYLFVDDLNDTKLGVKQSWAAFWTWGSREEYEATIGCTVQDKVGFENAIKCYEEAIDEINETECPSDISNVTPFKEKITKLAEKCSDDFAKLYKVEYLRQNKEVFSKKLNDALSNKLNSCQYTDCKLNAIDVANLNDALNNTTCKDGCSGLSGTEYDSCIDCLKKAYAKAGLDSTKTQCLLDTQKAKEEAQQELEEAVEEDQEENVQAQLQAQQEERDKVYAAYAQKAEIKEPVIPGGDLSTCNEILGENLAAIVRASITILQIVGAIIAIVKGMMTLIPPIIAKDADALKKAGKTLTTMAIVLVIIFLIRPLLAFIGNIVDFDTSCIL